MMHRCRRPNSSCGKIRTYTLLDRDDIRASVEQITERQFPNRSLLRLVAASDLYANTWSLTSLSSTLESSTVDWTAISVPATTW